MEFCTMFLILSVCFAFYKFVIEKIDGLHLAEPRYLSASKNNPNTNHSDL
jgi:hypothetical protein